MPATHTDPVQCDQVPQPLENRERDLFHRGVDKLLGRAAFIAAVAGVQRVRWSRNNLVDFEQRLHRGHEILDVERFVENGDSTQLPSPDV